MKNGGGGGGQKLGLHFISCSLHLLGGLGVCPPEKFWHFCVLRQLLVQSEANICLTVVSYIEMSLGIAPILTR